MPPPLTRPHRVVVQLNEIEPEALEKFKKHEAFECDDVIAEIEVIDNRTLKCNLSERPEGYQMQFDCVGFTNEPRIHSELARVMIDLMHQTSHSCVIHFAPLRHIPLQFLTTMLVQELNRRLVPTYCSLNCITLEYYDLRKYDVVNMLTKQEPSNNNSNSSIQRGKRRLCVKNFASTTEIFRWLRTDFVHLWTRGQGHDCFDVKIVYSDSRNRLHRVKLMLYQIYLSKLDTEIKPNLCNFLRDVGDARRSCTCVLTECLREFFDHRKPVSTLLLFEVPIMKGGVQILSDMLNLAEAAYIGSRSNMSGDYDLDVLSLDMNLLPSTSAAASRNLLKARSSKTLPMKSSDIATENLSMKDLNALSYWYNRVDEKFSDVIKAMEHYYQTVYQNKTEKIYSELKSIVNFSKSLQQVNLQQTPPNAVTSQSDSAMIQYKDAINEFRTLVKTVDRSTYSSLIRVYLKTKNYELLRHVLHFKEQQLENCQSSLVNAITHEISALQTIKNS